MIDGPGKGNVIPSYSCPPLRCIPNVGMFTLGRARVKQVIKIFQRKNKKRAEKELTKRCRSCVIFRVPSSVRSPPLILPPLSPWHVTYLFALCWGNQNFNKQFAANIFVGVAASGWNWIFNFCFACFGILFVWQKVGKICRYRRKLLMSFSDWWKHCGLCGKYLSNLKRSSSR